MPASGKKRLVMVGAFSTEGKFLGGESVKNNLLAEEFAARGVDVVRVDTAGWRGRPAAVSSRLLGAVSGGNRTVFLCSAAPGASIGLPPLVVLKQGFRFRLVYMVVGYAILQFIPRRPGLVQFMRRADEIYTETEGMQRDLAACGLSNVTHIPNLRRHVIVEHRTSAPAAGAGLRTVFFSRVLKSKGVDVAVEAVREHNQSRPDRKVRLDICGSCQPEERAWLDELIRGDSMISYCGRLADGDIHPTLARYHYMLFPSRYDGEVFPGAVLEAHAVGLPVLLSDWHYNAECVEEGKTGFVLPARDAKAWARKLAELQDLPESDYNRMSSQCVASLDRYSPDEVMSQFMSRIF